MTFQELLIEVKNLSHEEKNQLFHVLQDEMEEETILAVFKTGGIYDTPTPIFEGSLQPFIDMLERAKKTGEI
jgi:hypothetical protein